MDADGDGHASVASGGTDCNDDNPDIYPGAEEIPDDSVDNDCEGGDATCDSDGDGVQNPSCPGGTDCDDANSLAYPGADELCDGLDTNCDESIPANEVDADKDGVRGCAGDCRDDDALVSPLLDESCDGLDTNCDGTLPEDESDADDDGVLPCAGDVDNDGKSDLLIGAFNNDDGGTDAGKAYLYFGSTVATGGTFDLSLADALFVGAPQDWFGYSISSAGDFDGDNKSDLLIGAWKNSDVGNEAGKTFLFLGSTVASGGTFGSSQADYALLGEAGLDSSGVEVASAGDVDGDNRSDLLIGAYRNADGGEGAGKTYILFSLY